MTSNVSQCLETAFFNVANKVYKTYTAIYHHNKTGVVKDFDDNVVKIYQWAIK